LSREDKRTGEKKIMGEKEETTKQIIGEKKGREVWVTGTVLRIKCVGA